MRCPSKRSARARKPEKSATRHRPLRELAAPPLFAGIDLSLQLVNLDDAIHDFETQFNVGFRDSG